MELLKRAWIEISLDNLRYNYEQVKSLIPENTIIMAVLKANGYNCGDAQIAKELAKLDEKIQFAVSNINEAIELRKGGIKNPILILGYTPPELADKLFQHDITQTLVSFEYAKQLNFMAKELNVRPKVHIKLDTGMGRIGIVCYDEFFDNAVEEVKDIFGMENLEITGCYTHISTLYENDENSLEYTKIQYSRFIKITDYLKNNGLKLGLLHCLNSAGTANMPQMALDMVRPGTLIYGALPDMYNHSGIQFKPIVKVKATVAKVSTNKKSSYIGYSRAYAVTEDMKTAVLTIGYSDILRMGQGKGKVLINDKFCKVIGGVCMDQMVVDITHAGEVNVGDTAIVLGRYGENEITFEDMAQFLQAGEEEIYCHITSRPQRVYLDNGKIVLCTRYGIIEE